MQSFTYYKHSPINVEKSPRFHSHIRDTSKHREKSNIKLEYNVDKLISQIETMKKNFEYEKQLLQSQYLQTTQNKLNQFKKVETELINKNQLIEQLLLQEQLKVVQLTRAMQEKNKVNYDKEKESLRSKISYLEQQLIENQKSTQIKKTGTVEASTIQMIDIISQLQRLIIQTAKGKRLNLSWHDYDLLEVSLQAQRDKAKFLLQLQKIIQNFFKALEGIQVQSTSPYRVVEENVTPRGKQKAENEQQRFQNYLQQIQMKLETKDTSVQVSFDTIDEEKVVQERLLVDQQTQTMKQQKHKAMTQTDFFVQEQQKVLTICTETQTEQKEKKLKKMAYKHCQTEKITSVNQQCQTNTDSQQVKQTKENQITYPQNQQTQTEQIKSVSFEQQVNLSKPSNEASNQTELISKSVKDNNTEMAIIKYQYQESQTIKIELTNSLIQTNEILLSSTFVQTEQIQDKDNKDSQIIKSKEQKENNNLQSDIKKQVVSIEIPEQSENDSGSSYDVNSPTFSTPFVSNANNQDKLILKQKEEYIERLQAKLMETIQHYEEELYKKSHQLKFDIQVKSTQQSLQQLIDDKWEMQFKDKEAEQVFSIGFISFSQQLLSEIMCSLIDNSYSTKLELNSFYCKYYDQDFIENYRADLMFKVLHNYEQIISDSKLKNQYLNYDMFWIDLISNNCKQLIYITDTNNFNDQRLINYLITKNKPLTIISFQLEKFDGFTIQKDYKQNQEKQFLQLQDDRELLKLSLLQIFQGDIQWEPNESQFFQILQQELGQIAEIWDFQVTMKEDDQFDISIQSDDIVLKNIIPHIQNVQYEKSEITIDVENKQQIENVIVNDMNTLIFFQDYMIIERLKEKAKLNKIEGSRIYLTY